MSGRKTPKLSRVDPGRPPTWRGTVVSFTSLRLVPNDGHIHLYLDGSLISMTTGLDAQIAASPGLHELRAEFVALDHGPFQPQVVATVTFSVHG